MRLLFTLTIFAGSSLLFLVQPLIAKQLLPVFGGSPLVWNTSLLFFQTMLLLGYVYAHFSIKRFGAKTQSLIHFGIVALALLSLPLRVPEALRSAYERALATNPNSIMASPAPVLLMMLFASVGLPFFALSAGAPTIQRWFSTTKDPSAKEPYFLYQASNLASMVALLGYPLWFERQFPLPDQSKYWSYGFAAVLVLIGICALALRNQSDESLDTEQESEIHSAPPTSLQRFKWVFLAACPTALMAGATSYLTTNVAPIPLLWVLPLALYLVTFIIVFSKRLKRGDLIKYFGAISVFPVAILLLMEKHYALYEVPVHLIGFFCVTLACHYEIARTRPEPDHLTEFYVWMSVGGMVGGFFAAIVSPLVFSSLSEYPVAIVGAFLAIALANWDQQKAKWYDLLVPTVCILGVAFLKSKYNAEGQEYYWAYGALAMFALCSLRPLRLAGSLTALFVMQTIMSFSEHDNILLERSFFGTLTVRNKVDGGDTLHSLVHGNILHGAEWMNGENKDMPITYYSSGSGLGQAFLTLGDTPLFDKVAVVGLGAGTSAAWGRPGQQFDYYELDPNVERMARNPKYFTYVPDSKANVNVLIGDARIRLSQATPGTYGLIALDAFSSDAIPVHLLTKEAIDSYFRALKPNGVLMLHISNRFLKLDQVVSALVAQEGYFASELVNSDLGPEDTGNQVSASDWVLLTKDKGTFDAVTSEVSEWTPLARRRGYGHGPMATPMS